MPARMISPESLRRRLLKRLKRPVIPAHNGMHALSIDQQAQLDRRSTLAILRQLNADYE